VTGDSVDDDVAPTEETDSDPAATPPERSAAEKPATEPDASASSSFVRLMARAAEITSRKSQELESPVEEPPSPPRRRKRRDTLPGIPVPRARRGFRGSFQRIVKEAENRAAETKRKRVLWPLYALRITIQVFRQWARDRCPQQAASLAFQSVLSIVPVIAVALAVLRSTDSLDAQSSLVDFLASQFIPVSRDEISAKLVAWSENVTFESLGMIGLITTLFLAFLIVNSLERITNHIWRAERKRSLAQKFVIFYATATLGPFLIGAGLYQAGKFGLTEGSSGLSLSFATTFGALFMANYFLPACRVRPVPAFVGALVSTILFEAAKYAFNLYVSDFAFDRYTGVYGAVAVAPLFLLWLYYSWLTLLLGFEIAHAVQNLHLLERIDRRGTMSLENELLRRVNGVVAARVMVAISESYIRGDKVLTRRALERRFDLSDDVVERIAQRLKQADLLLEIEGEHRGFIPARPPQEISLANVLSAFRGDDVVIAVTPGERSRLDKVLVDIEADMLQRTSHLYLDELI
jgi:membrane protein